MVTLASPPLARAPGAAGRIDAEQRAFRAALARELPEARLGWRYRLVQNGYAVSLPASQVAALRALPGVRGLYVSATYAPLLDRSTTRIGASALWGSALGTAGQGVKIGIIDSGVDHRHPFFDPEGYTMPAGFPKGQTRFTSAKVIVARAFPPSTARAESAGVAFHPNDSGHGTHVAGIAAGNHRTRAVGGRVVSGVAPRAYIGSYKVFVETDAGISPNANSPAIVAAIEAAVADGMDVINFSGGEPELEPSRDVVALALDAAAAAGVVPVVAAGNDFDAAGVGSVSSPANSLAAISVGAVDSGGSRDVRADFSSVGPTPVSHRLKPDVSAPGVSILSAAPDGDWTGSSGTSMAAPHIAGAAALLRQRHPEWTVAQLKSALVQTGTEVAGDSPPTFQGGGAVSLVAADRPLLFAQPSSLSFGLLSGQGSALEHRVELRDAGGGAGAWTVTVDERQDAPGVSLELAASTVTVPGELALEVRVAGVPRTGEVSGYLVLRRGADVRRIPYWGLRTAQGLARHRPVRLESPGVRRATTRGRPSLVSRYRYPENPIGMSVSRVLAGPELVYRVRITRRVANFGVAITSRAGRSQVEPRVVAGLDENRLTGYAGLPTIGNPYLEGFRSAVLAAGALSPKPGEYAVVFDSRTGAGAGRFTFRFWVNDVTPPTLRVRTRRVAAGRPILVAATDAGSGVYPQSVAASLGGNPVRATYAGGVVRVSTRGLARGTYRLRLQVSDYQETRNTENVARILPNTRTLNATVTVR